MSHSHASSQAIPLSLRISPDIMGELEVLADATGRTKSFLAAEAIRAYLKEQAWQITAIENAVKKAKNKKTKTISHDKVSDWLLSWGAKSKRKPPR